MLLIGVWKEIFKKKRYVFLTLFIEILFYLLNAFIVEWKNLPLIRLVGLWDVLFLGFYASVFKITFITTLAIGLLTGMLVSLLTYRFNKMHSALPQKVGFLSSIGIFLGLVAPGCAACGIGLTALLGLGSILALLPFKGAELSFLALSLLIFSIWRVSISFVRCDVRLPA